MSNVEWAAGSVVVPAAELANLKRSFRKRYNILIDNAYDEAKRFRAANPTSSVPKWHMAIDLETAKIQRGNIARHIALAVAESMEKPKAIKWENFDEAHFGKIGVGATEFPLLSSTGEKIGAVRFQSRKMSWEIYQGNHAVDTFNDSVDSAFLYNTLNLLKWVKGTGGGESYYSELGGKIVISRKFGVIKKKYQHNYPTRYTLPEKS